MPTSNAPRSWTAGLLLAAALAVAACGSDAATDATDPAVGDPGTTAAASGEPSSTATTATATTAAAAAAGTGCPDGTAVTVTSTHGGYPDGIDWSTVHAVAERGLAMTGGDAENVVVYLGTQPRPLAELASSQTELAPTEGVIRLELVNGGDDTVSGTYRSGPDVFAPFHLHTGIKVTDRTTLQFQTSKEQGEAELVVDGDQVCGTFQVEDGLTSVAGTFVAEVAP